MSAEMIEFQLAERTGPLGD